eukprot:CAMPEP_0201127348 /NCGR_PEP_ID=MMETSP0850-20130426/29997_1 /ASSEMBLY_ACC=CAM_ASM_000622 /TAXON_ID=183588 /ORGANISM="Pseudo-nitzschia fraudulenta, Strain WWA7" /LENGTH=48 /DNA_ID= /DNA_START= /DNA_END= /DNA_ORIENTATION=
MTDKYVIALVVKGHYLPALEFGVVGEQAAQQSAHPVTQAGAKAVEVQL